MKSVRPRAGVLRVVSASTVALLAACGGGGGGDAPAPAPGVAPPSAGSYAWVLKLEGSTSGTRRYGLSLLHPAATDVEWVIESPSAVVTDARSVARGTVDTGAQRVADLQPYALVYVVGGDVRRVPLAANGSTPLSQVRRAGSASACGFVLDAVDHANPESSRFIVSTAGNDGSCGTADDGRAEVRFDATQGLVYSPITGEAPLGLLRDPATFAPTAWIGATQVRFWDGSTVALPSTITGVVAASGNQVLVQTAAGLTMLTVSNGKLLLPTPIGSLASGGWRPIGHDAEAFYAYRNSDTTTNASWSVARITRQLPAGTVLATGSGQFSDAALGNDVIYATVRGTSLNRLLRMAKSSANSLTTLESTPTTAVSTVLTSSVGVHQVWRIADTGSSVQYLDENGNAVSAAVNAALPVAVLEPTAIDWLRSENRQRFVHAEGFGSLGFSGAALVGFDSATRSTVAIGTLPGGSQFGTDVVYANAFGGPGSRGAGVASRSVAGSVQGAGAVAFSFDAASAGSLKLATRQQ